MFLCNGIKEKNLLVITGLFLLPQNTSALRTIFPNELVSRDQVQFIPLVQLLYQFTSENFSDISKFVSMFCF